MKKLYRKGTVHPSPPIISDHLAFLPAAILTLTAALSPEDREVLAYLISCSNNNLSGQKRSANVTQKSTNTTGDHPPLFSCDCFRCYMSYWVRWDSSPNRQLIHEIINAFEDGLVQNKKTVKPSKKERRKKGGAGGNGGNGGGGGSNGGSEVGNSADSTRTESGSGKNEVSTENDSVGENSGGSGGCGDEKEGGEKGSVRNLVSFIGERIWSVWGQ
ncbi:neurogenic protein mastermind [Carica papaya]|uniref:neurogenic protein mastermind n=1 Tax=Carica papaya TaxID=3649 RepID=UPI000B8C751B|nr:neurogenic protein mastermind [Carica papaya]